jgi:hypothetical protein
MDRAKESPLRYSWLPETMKHNFWINLREVVAALQDVSSQIAYFRDSADVNDEVKSRLRDLINLLSETIFNLDQVDVTYQNQSRADNYVNINKLGSDQLMRLQNAERARPKIVDSFLEVAARLGLPPEEFKYEKEHGS